MLKRFSNHFGVLWVPGKFVPGVSFPLGQKNSSFHCVVYIQPITASFTNQHFYNLSISSQFHTSLAICFCSKFKYSKFKQIILFDHIQHQMKTILPFKQQKSRTFISIDGLKDIIRYRHFKSLSHHKLMFSIIFPVRLRIYFPHHQTDVKQSGYCTHVIPLFNTLNDCGEMCIYLFIYKLLMSIILYIRLNISNHLVNIQSHLGLLQNKIGSTSIKYQTLIKTHCMLKDNYMRVVLLFLNKSLFLVLGCTLKECS